MRILWDEPKRLANLDKHGLDFADVTPAFFETAVIRPARHGRMLALGLMESQLVALIFAVYGTQAVSLVSLRTASEVERRLIAWRKN